MADKIGCIKVACGIADSIFSDLVKCIYSFRTESDIDRFIRKQARLNKVNIAFSPIVASGRNAANPHHKPTKAKLKGFVVVDFGVKFNGYCSDMTRMLFFGKPSAYDLKVYDLLLGVQEKSVKDLKIGGKYYHLDKNARTRLGKYKKFFIHSLGHGVGKKVHEKPIIASVFKKKTLTPKRLKRIEKIKNAKIGVGDVITIEPGIYVKKRFGLRIEDTVLIRKDDAEVLTKSQKYLVIV